jgi:integrase
MLIEALKKEKEQQESYRQLLGPLYNPANLVVCRENGSYSSPHALYSAFQELLQRIGLPRISLHDLRHSHATYLLEEGVHPKVVSERLGHADPAITLRVYSHVLENIQQVAADRVDTMLRRVSLLRQRAM